MTQVKKNICDESQVRKLRQIYMKLAKTMKEII